jgi:hypothetical protein
MAILIYIATFLLFKANWYEHSLIDSCTILQSGGKGIQMRHRHKLGLSKNLACPKDLFKLTQPKVRGFPSDSFDVGNKISFTFKTITSLLGPL